jgi:hypothetical protein
MGFRALAIAVALSLVSLGGVDGYVLGGIQLPACWLNMAQAGEVQVKADSTTLAVVQRITAPGL